MTDALARAKSAHSPTARSGGSLEALSDTPRSSSWASPLPGLSGMRHVASDLANQSPMAIPSAVQEARDQPLRNSHYGSLTDAERGLRAKNAPAGPLTLLSRKSTAAAAATANEQLPLPSAAVVARETGDEVFPDTMSLAAVESIQRLPTVDDDHAGPLRSRTARHSRASKAPFINSRIDRVLAPLKRVAQPVANLTLRPVHRAMCHPEEAERRLALVFMTILGLCAALLTFVIDVSIENAFGWRVRMVKSIEAPLGATAVWVAHAFVWAMLAVMVTYKLSPLAAGSGIPEIKSILSGNVLLYRCLNKRTLAAKVLGLFAALSAGLPLGKEGPFIHMACCLSEWLLSLRPFRELKQSYAMRTQMLMAACAVGVGANFGAPVGGVLLAIELTSKYFLLAVYWKCFYTAVVGAMLSRLLYMAYKTKTHVLNATFGSFFDAEEIEADVLQLPAFILIGVLAGCLGALFVWLNSKWFAFRARNSQHRFFTSRYAFTATLILAWALITAPAGPFGSFMSKSQMSSLSELLATDVLGPEWGESDMALAGSLVVFFVLRCAFTCIGITLPVPCGVFAPMLCAGAGLGRLVGEEMRRLLPDHDTSPGGYATLGAAAMAAGATHTISSAVLMFELTGGMKHALPMLITVIISYMVSVNLSPSIFDSILRMKKLPFLWEFKQRNSFHRSAREVLSHLIERGDHLDRMRRVFILLRGGKHEGFARWRLAARAAKRVRPTAAAESAATPLVVLEPTALPPLPPAPKPSRRASPATCCVYRSVTYGELEHLLEVHTYPFFPWVEETTQLLLGAIRRSTLKAAVDARKRKYALNERVVLSQRFAAHRACNTLHNAELSAPSAPASASRKPDRKSAAAPTPPRPAQPPKQPAAPGVLDRYARAISTALRGRSTHRTMMDDVVDADAAVATVEEEMELAACDSASEITGATQKWDDDVPLFAGGSSALPLAPPAPAQASGDDGGGGDDAARAAGALEPAAALALEREQGKDAAAKPATNGSGAAGGGHVRIKGRIASCASIAYLSEASAQVELDRSRWQSVNTADGLQLTCTRADYLDVPITDEDWLMLGVEEAPFCIAASASMGQVHFYFSMLSLSCAFVTDHGKYVGMITQADLMAANL